MAIKTLKSILKIYHSMEILTKRVNQLIEKTFEMKKFQDPRLQPAIEEAIDPCNQSQPLPDYKEEEHQSENIPTEEIV